MVKPFDTLPKNFAGMETLQSVAAGVLGFDSNSPGHKIATHCLLDLQDNFSGVIWGNNGPGVITRMAQKFCIAENVSQVLESPCAAGLNIFPPNVFYPVSWKNWTVLVEDATEEFVEELVKNSYVVHMWNKLSSETLINVNDNVVYNILAKKYCPKVFEKVKEYF